MTRRRLTLLLALFFLALAVPTSVLVYQAYGQLKWEAFYQHQRLARELMLRIDDGFRNLIDREQNRPVGDYEFAAAEGEGSSAVVQRSPLSRFPTESAVPGVLGYFQVDAGGRLHTPILPDAEPRGYGIAAPELRQREQQAARIRAILDENRLVGRGDGAGADKPATIAHEAVADEAPAMAQMRDRQSLGTEDADQPESYGSVTGAVALEATPADAGGASGDGDSQLAFDKLSSRAISASGAKRAPAEQVKDLKLDDNYQVAAEPLARNKAEAKRARKEQAALPQALLEKSIEPDAEIAEQASPGVAAAPFRQPLRIETFESEVEPMEFALLDSGHFVLFRRVWHRDQRYVQGVLIDQQAFIDALIRLPFEESSLSSMSELIVAWRGDILRQYAAEYSRLYRPSAEQDRSELLYQGRLLAPFGDLELIFTLARLPVGAGGQVIIWSALVLAVVLIGGCLMLLRLGQRQLALARQQQDFVSAVSHELKTPLTSIRMYGEMLREGWADEARRKTYYDFIFHEAERLTRLINNVLQLARLSRNEQSASLQGVSVGAALADLRPRLESQLEPTGFDLLVDGDAQADEVEIRIDIDWFIQIFINLVDNALKFSANAATRRIDIHYRRLQDGRVEFAVRDYGPGIEAGQMKKIFTLFYRSENELTRETVGTGIGLALVHQLASAMRAEVDVVNAGPGAEFRIRFATESTG